MTESSATYNIEPMPLAPVFSEIASFSSEGTHIRIQTTKNTKGYSFETVVSVDGSDSEMVREKVQQLLVETNTIARQEVERLELLDGVLA